MAETKAIDPKIKAEVEQAVKAEVKQAVKAEVKQAVKDHFQARSERNWTWVQRFGWIAAILAALSPWLVMSCRTPTA